jgi:hypothetical protein
MRTPHCPSRDYLPPLLPLRAQSARFAAPRLCRLHQSVDETRRRRRAARARGGADQGGTRIVRGRAGAGLCESGMGRWVVGSLGVFWLCLTIR